MITENNEIRVAIEDWGLYNAGILACKWWDADNTIEEIQKFYSDLRLKHGIFPHDDLELFNADWEGSNMINENTGFLRVKEISETLDELEEIDKKKIDYLMDYNGCSYDEALEKYEDVELYEDMTMIELADMFIDETWEVPEHLVNYIDSSAFANDLSMDGSKEIDTAINKVA